jgi:hypothetical protein
MAYFPGYRVRAAAPGVTARLSPHSIGCVNSRTARMLTKRRAVDFCHVATAICPRAALS